MRVVWAFITLFLMTAGQAHAQYIGAYQWEVTHTAGLAASLVGAEGTRATLEANIAAQKSFQASVWQTAVGNETYHALSAYAKFLRILRQMKQIKNAYKNLSFKGKEWALLPQLKLTAPVELQDEHGNTFVSEKEMFSLSLVPPELQTNWDLGRFPDDDFLMKRNGQKTFIQFDYPHKLADVQLTFTPSPFLNEASDPESGMQELMAHSYEALLVASARLAGYGVHVNPQVLEGGNMLLAGRATPDQIKLQASIYENQALSIIDKIVRIYIDHGMSINNATRRYAPEAEFWKGFAAKAMVGQSARVAFAMNLMSEVNQTLARLECSERRQRDAETDEAFQHMGERKVDGMYKPINSIENI